VSANPSTAMAEPPCAARQGVKALTFRPLLPSLFHMRTRPASGCPHAPSPARTPPPRWKPSRTEAPRCTVSPSCADAWSKAVLFLDLARLGYNQTCLRCGSSHRRRTSPSASCGQATVPLGQTIVAAKPSGIFPHMPAHTPV
jgi:hypothetical protein